MNKYSRVLLRTLAIILVLTSSALAGSPNRSQEMSDEYSSPQLLISVRPEPVEYAPGRMIEGFVTLEIRVGIDGIPRSANVLYKTSNLAVSHAIQALEQWRFAPATLHGKPVESLVTYSLPFGQNLSIFANSDYPDKIWNPETGELLTMK